MNQNDSRVMRDDSHSMKTIAIVGLLFLPPATLAAIFSSVFFSFFQGDDGAMRWEVSPFFWVFWVVSVPVTIAVIVLRKWELSGPRKFFSIT